MKKLVACLLVVAFAGCGYRARFDLPPHLQTFSVATFSNKTLERNLDFEFTQALIREIQAKTRLRVAPSQEADLLVTGEIDELDRLVLRRGRLGAKSEMGHRLCVNVAMLERKKGRVFFEGKRITGRAEFRLYAGETERMARDELVREVARSVVSRAFEEWPARPVKANAGSG